MVSLVVAVLRGNQVEMEKCTHHKNCSLERTNTKYGEGKGGVKKFLEYDIPNWTRIFGNTPKK